MGFRSRCWARVGVGDREKQHPCLRQLEGGPLLPSPRTGPRKRVLLAWSPHQPRDPEHSPGTFTRQWQPAPEGAGSRWVWIGVILGRAAAFVGVPWLFLYLCHSVTHFLQARVGRHSSQCVVVWEPRSIGWSSKGGPLSWTRVHICLLLPRRDSSRAHRASLCLCLFRSQNTEMRTPDFLQL